LRIGRAVAADSADIGPALLVSDKAAISSLITYRVIGAPRIVLGIGVRAGPRDPEENRTREQESLHGAWLHILRGSGGIVPDEGTQSKSRSARVSIVPSGRKPTMTAARLANMPHGW